MRDRFSMLSILPVLSLFLATAAIASTPALTRSDKAAIVTSLNETLKANYVFPDIAQKIAPVLGDHLQKGDYDSAKTKDEFAKELTDDLIKVSGDYHFFVGVDAKFVADVRGRADPAIKAKIRQEERARLQETNFGFEEVSRLNGNIGYIRFTYFADPEFAYDTAAASMHFVENCDAVIIDLRYNNGGYLEMAQFLASYFFPSDKDQLLFDYNYNEDGKPLARGQWVLPGLPGARMVNKPLYILTGSTSFSSAEWFSYAMKKLGRATLIGERTAGGAHPVDRKPINDDFFVQVPIGQIRDPVDHGDFEGTGVQPDIQSPSIQALPLAHRLALENLSKSNAGKKEEYTWLLPALTAQIDRPVIDASVLQKAVGKYEGREIVLENGRLFYIWRTRLRVALEPIGPNLFAVEGVSEFRYRLSSQNGKTTSLERVNRDGSIQSYKRIG